MKLSFGSPSGEQSSRLRRVVVVVGVLVLVATVVPFAVYAVPQVVGADHGFVVLSGSMEPAMSPGDVVIVGAATDIVEGDIITFEAGNDVPTTHRVVDVQEGGYLTKGDANEESDDRLVTSDEVVGRVAFVIPLVGHVILWVNTPVGYVALVLAPLVLLLGGELYDWARHPGADADAEGASGGTGAASGSGDGAPADGESTVAVAAADLKLTFLVSAVLFAYAGWNVYGEVTGFAGPDPVSVGALTAGLLASAFAAWVTVAAWLRTREVAGTSDLPASLTPGTDGGTDTDGTDDDA